MPLLYYPDAPIVVPPVCAKTSFDAGVPAFVAPQPTGAGQFRDVTSVAQFNALENVAVPGDVIRITQQINLTGTTALKWDGRGGIRPDFPDGTAANPITITCSGAGEIRQVTTWPGGQFPEGLVIQGCNHVHAVGNKIFGGQFPFRFISSHGTAAAPAKIWHNDIRGGRDAQLYVGSASNTNYPEASFVSVKYNVVTDALPTGFTNEGIYLGVGSTVGTWQDETHDIEVAYNHISNHQGDGIDVKLGVYNVDIHHNLIHDIGAHFGSGITSGTTNNAPGDNPNPGRISNYKIYNNWIYNVGYNHNGVSSTNSSYGMYLSRPGTECYNNIIWGLNPANDVRGITSVSYVQESNQLIDIYNNTIWVSGGNALAGFTSAGASALNITYRNNLTGDGSKGSTTVTAANFAGPIPGFQSGPTSANDDADAGDGAGSGFTPVAGATNIVGAATGTIPGTDAFGVARPQGTASERGAIELCE